MTAHASGMTDAEDERPSAAGGTVAGAVIGAPEAQPLASHDIEMDRSRDGGDSMTDKTRKLNEDRKKALLAEEARKYLQTSLSEHYGALSNGGGRDRRSVVGRPENGQVHVPDEATLLMSKSEAFAIVKDARQLIKGKPPKPQSQADYQRKAHMLRAQGQSSLAIPDGEYWCRVLEAYAGQPASYRAYRAACCWSIRCQIEKGLAEQDRIQRTGDRGDQWLQQIEILKHLAADLRTVQDCARPVPPLLDGMTLARRKSKKQDLRRIAKLYPGWMSRMLWSARRTQYLDAVRILSLVGCRPEELFAGVTIHNSEEGRCLITINGAKVTESAGQPWRRIHLPVTSLPFVWQKQLAAGQPIQVRVASKDGLRKCLQRLSSRVLAGAPFATAYVYRHAFATRLRDAGFSAEEIGAAMGHSVAETQSVYGVRAGGRGKKRIKRISELSVEVARPVPALDRSGLKKVRATKKAHHGKTKASAR